jgi:hypothetical protein
MTRLVEKIEQLSELDKNDHVVAAIQLDSKGRPDCVFVGMEGNFISRLGMIDILIRQLELVREDLHEELENHQDERRMTDNGEKKPPVGPNEQTLRNKVETLPKELQGPVNKLLDKIKADIFKDNDKSEPSGDIKEAFVQDFFKEVNKRFGFEGNAINPEE